MEAFESFVALTMEEDTGTHGFEVDLVGARRDELVLAAVESFFGARPLRVFGPQDIVTTAPTRARTPSTSPAPS